MRCGICGKLKTGSTDPHDAMNEGWEPTYWLNEMTEVDEPICPDCSATHCKDHESGGALLREGAAVPIDFAGRLIDHMLWAGPAPTYPDVVAMHHIDGNPANNDLDNLQMVNVRENRRPKP